MVSIWATTSAGISIDLMVFASASWSESDSARFFSVQETSANSSCADAEPRPRQRVGGGQGVGQGHRPAGIHPLRMTTPKPPREWVAMSTKQPGMSHIHSRFTEHRRSRVLGADLTTMSLGSMNLTIPSAARKRNESPSMRK